MQRFTATLLASLALCSFLLAMVLDRWIARTEIPGLTPEVSTVVLDANGELLRAFTTRNGRWRLPVALDQVDTGYLQQLIAFEDKRYYRHAGIDTAAMLRAVAQMLWHQRIISGGSTLTMQVARLLEDGPNGRWAAKLRQIRVALALEQKLSKSQILTLYLTLAPFGGNLEGVRAASLAYFNKEPKRLTPAQAALLVALPQAPEARKPEKHPTAAKQARDRVLRRSATAGVLSREAAQAGLSEKAPRNRIRFATLAPHLAEQISRDHPLQSTHRLTIDKTLQRQLQMLAHNHAQRQNARLSAAILVADHRNGAVKALVGAADYLDEKRSGFIDMTQAIRSPGSTLKPLIYGLAFELGQAHPETLIEDRPTAFGSYAPQNFDRQFHGSIRLRRALQMSLNIPAVALLDSIGPARLLARMKRAGVTAVMPHNRPPGLAVALGGLGISLRDLVTLYGSLANGGQVMELRYSQADRPDLPQKNPMLSRRAAWYVSDILAGAIPPPNAPKNHLSYKTGTSYGHRDAWAVGFDGQHVVGVWLGRPDGAAMPGVLGGDLAAPLLFEVFARLKPALVPLLSAPKSALIVSNARLPKPLQQFRGNRAPTLDENLPEIAFPPNGARVTLSRDNPILALKVRNGKPPFTWLADGRPVEIGSYERQTILHPQGAGHMSISVIDAEGRSQVARIYLE